VDGRGGGGEGGGGLGTSTYVPWISISQIGTLCRYGVFWCSSKQDDVGRRNETDGICYKQQTQSILPVVLRI